MNTYQLCMENLELKWRTVFQSIWLDKKREEMIANAPKEICTWATHKSMRPFKNYNIWGSHGRIQINMSFTKGTIMFKRDINVPLTVSTLPTAPERRCACHHYDEMLFVSVHSLLHIWVLHAGTGQKINILLVQHTIYHD
jgi:hypothetical protein